ncbi:MAG: hypothetical protein JSV03_07620, partial [Planctomycetota bacterium]
TGFPIKLGMTSHLPGLPDQVEKRHYTYTDSPIGSGNNAIRICPLLGRAECSLFFLSRNAGL